MGIDNLSFCGIITMSMRIRICKRSSVPGGAPARRMEDHVPGMGDHFDGKSIPLDYTVEGVLAYPITIGRPVLMARDKRNGVDATGTFITSPVVNVVGNTFWTNNSIYDFNYLKD